MLRLYIRAVRWDQYEGSSQSGKRLAMLQILGARLALSPLMHW